MGSAKITLQDVYTVVNRLEDKFDDQFKDQDKRIREVEDKQARQGGINAAISFLTSAVIGIVAVWFRR